MGVVSLSCLNPQEINQMLPDFVSFYSDKDLTLPEEAHTQPCSSTAILLLLS